MLIDGKCGLNSLMTLLGAILLFATPARAQTGLEVLVTSNLQGRFTTVIQNQDTEDPLLRLGQNIMFERENGIDAYFDMGNAFYPGILSKYSSGSIMMDFLEFFACDAVLISSKDLQIGTKNLEFLQKSKNVRLLSANIVQDHRPVFNPWFVLDHAGTRIAVVGLSSNKIRFDMAEKDLYGYDLVEDKEILKGHLDAIRAAGIEHIILLSGRNYKETSAILETYPVIGLALCGGDYTGRIFTGRAARVDLVDGRSILMAEERADYHVLRLSVDDTIHVQAWEPRNAAPIETRGVAYQEFKRRLSLWKETFREYEGQPLAANLGAAAFEVDDLRLGQLLRDRFNCELGIVEENTINPLPDRAAITQADILDMVHRDYNIFTFTLTGQELRIVQKENEELAIAGLSADSELKIQGHLLAHTRSYRIAATQPAMQRIRRLLGKKIDSLNAWVTVTDLVTSDLSHDRVLLRADYSYLDRRFRTTLDVYLANFFDSSNVDKGENIDTPPGQPAKSYTKWGLENKIDLTVYNNYHRFVFIPYMLYSRQEDLYLNNILRGTFLYDYNLSEATKPYNKIQVDTVVEQVDGLRPVLIRETLGFAREYKYWGAKLGVGFEKEVQDPANAALYGVEVIVGARIPLLPNVDYILDLDTFTGIRDEGGGQRQIRSEITNGIFVKVNAILGMSFRNRFFYLREDVTGETYRNSQFIVSLDLKKDWKFW